jgi:leucyl aminopeptidase (aminopeptidase T)
MDTQRSFWIRVKPKITLLLAAFSVVACARQESSGFDLERLFVDVFAPKAGEKVLFIVDTPGSTSADSPAWEDRRAMADEWHSTIAGMEEELGITVLPLMSYKATGSHNGPLPDDGLIAGEYSPFEEVLSQTNIAIAMTEFSATAPMMEYAAKFPELRVASMPMVSRSMQSTALAADYASVSVNCRALRDHLDRAVGAEVEFSTGHEMYFDLRHRTAEVDDGRLDGRPGSARVINLPSGEAFIAPYEGEIEGDPSRTQGLIPVAESLELSDGYVIAVVRGNQIIDLLDDGTTMASAAEGRRVLEQDAALRNVAELGLGCNPSAVVTGNVLEDEKVVGMHWALGRSDHIGGTVGPEDFTAPELVTHMDWVYPVGGQLEAINITLEYEDGSSEKIISDGRNLILDESQNLDGWVRPVLLIWVLIAAGCWAWLAWDAERFSWSPPSRKYLWALSALAFGPVGLGLYYRSPHRTEKPTDRRES